MESNKLKNHELIQWYADRFQLFMKQLNGDRQPTLDALRERAMKQFISVGFPDRREEEWRYTDISPLLQKKFHVGPQESAETPIERRLLELNELPFHGIVFVDGRYSPELSTVGEAGDSIELLPLVAAVDTHPEFFETHGMEEEKDPFVLLNRAFSWKGLYLRFPENYHSSRPFQIVQVFSENAEGFAHYPRLLLHFEKNARVHLISRSLSMSDAEYFVSGAVSSTLEEGADVSLTTIQDQSRKSYLFYHTQVLQHASSRASLLQFDFGGRIARNRTQFQLAGEQAESNLIGFYLASGNQLIDNHTVIDHIVPRCTSNELFKGILADQAQGVFSGMVHVRRPAQKTNAFQQNKNLLLSREAKVSSKPILKIYADDVRCTHGATTGHLDDEALFYLRQRGISLANARNMLRFAFANEVLDQASPDPLRLWLTERLQHSFDQLSES